MKAFLAFISLTIISIVTAVSTSIFSPVLLSLLASSYFFINEIEAVIAVPYGNDNVVVAVRTLTLRSGESLKPLDVLYSPNSRYFLTMQEDGNLVLYKRIGLRGQKALWASKTLGGIGSKAAMQEDGNLVIYVGDKPIWRTLTHGNPGATLNMQDDGNLVIYTRSGRAIWRTATTGR